LVQTVEASAAEYLPASQSAQVEATLAPTASENLPAAQSVQTVEASAAEYLPAPQSCDHTHTYNVKGTAEKTR
jgi:hypothetical protein